MPAPSEKLPITVTIITLNEENNLARALKSVDWADDILVVDCGSTDKTREIAAQMGARVLENPWPGYGQQKNFAQKHARHDWVLNLDGDEEVSPELAAEIRRIVTEAAKANGSTVRAFRIPRKTYYLGRWIMHGGWYPNYVTRLADRRYARWTEPDVHERLEAEGKAVDLESPLLHYSFSGIRDQVETNVRFSWLGYQNLRKAGKAPSLFLLLTKPVGKFVETYLIKRGFLDGIAGLIISINAAHSIFLKYAYLFEAEIETKTHERRKCAS